MTWQRGNSKHVPTSTRNRILNRDGNQCRQCGSTEHLEVDHINNQRGEHYDHDTNLQVLCAQCHKAKTARESAHARRQRSQRAKMTIQPHPGLLAN